MKPPTTSGDTKSILFLQKCPTILLCLACSIYTTPPTLELLLTFIPPNKSQPRNSRHSQGTCWSHIRRESKFAKHRINPASYTTFPYLGKSNHPQQAMMQTAINVQHSYSYSYSYSVCLSVCLAISIYTTPTTLAYLLTFVPPNQSQPINSRHIQGTCWKLLHLERKKISQALNQSRILLT